MVSSCCFQGLLDSTLDDIDLAGMGTVIIGNVCKALKQGDFDHDRHLELHLQMEPESDLIQLPWPGMPDDSPVPLDVDLLPFDAVPFYEKEDGRFKRLIDRQRMMMRIKEVWVPYLKSEMERHGASSSSSNS